MATKPTWQCLEAKDDAATTAVIDCLQACTEFVALSESEYKDIVARDDKDASALVTGIEKAQAKGVLEKITPAPYKDIQVLGKTGSQVADEIGSLIGEENLQKGCVMVLVGLSGTGKGTTVEKLKQKLPDAQTWSNGNVFRCLTLLACQHADSQGVAYDKLESLLSPENLSAWCDRLRFDKINGKWDIEVTTLGDQEQKLLVSEICDTTLKEPRISQNIPTVATYTQGEVVKFAAAACTKMGAGGTVVLVEGREQTIDFIPTEHRFCLTLSDTSLIGKRRAAQRILGQALKKRKEDSLEDKDPVAFLEQVAKTL